MSFVFSFKKKAIILAKKIYMYKSILLSSFFLLIITASAFSQCTICNEENSKTTFCYQNEAFEGYCAVFTDGKKIVSLKKGKKTKTISLSANASLNDLITISKNKKPKVSALDVLFLQEALKVWFVESRKLGMEYTESGLGIKMIKEGDGVLPEKGQKVKVHYSGYLADGEKFDSSVDRDEPFDFVLGAGRVIKGWDEGFAKLKVGSKAILEIPAKLGYGNRGAGGVIPPGATLYFEIELLGVE